jgi:hypothetical protein
MQGEELDNAYTRELLKPRYKVKALYPKCIFIVGEIVHGDLIFCDPDGDKFYNYPHLFTKLNWWVERGISQLPKYVKSHEGIEVDFVLKVEKYMVHNESGSVWAFEYLWEQEKDIKRMSMSGWLPATEKEYNDYINKKSNG